MLKTMEHYGFGNNFLRWMKILYKKPKGAILVDGYLSSLTDITMGIKQGDALSALLYIVQSEPLGDKIRQSW